MEKIPSHSESQRPVSVRDTADRAPFAGGVSSPLVPIDALRRVAADAGIDAAAFDAAFRRTAGIGLRRPPFWVRFVLFGVPDRAAATSFYWLFVSALVLLVPAMKLDWLPQSKGTFALCWFVFSLFTTNA